MPAPPLRAHHAQLLHPEPQRVRVDAQALGGVAGAVDPPAAPLEHGFDVGALHRVEVVRSFGGAAMLRVAERQRRVELQRVAVDAIIARSTTFSSSRTLPGQA